MSNGGELSQVNPQGGELTAAESVNAVIQQHNMIRDLLKSVLKVDVHYGEIPGTRRNDDDPPKNVLFKPGAEKIAFLTRMVPTFEFVQRDFPEGHREYEATCTLRLRGTDIILGQGVGVCSTLESKYRYRWDNTGKEVPKEYWDTGRDVATIGGSSYTARKGWKDKKQGWYIFRRVEHADPADYYNTVKKIAKKRSYVDGVITATACGDLFTQDVIDEDGEVMPGAEAATQETAAPAAKAEPQRKSAAKPAPAPTGNGTTWRGKVTGCTVKKRGKKANGSDYTIFTIQAADGLKFDTFSDTHADIASSCAKTGEDVVITYKRDDYGNTAESVEVAGVDEPGVGG